jgi:transposase
VVKPHKTRYWLNSPLRKTPEFIEAAANICDLYKQAPELHKQGIHVISNDEKTGMQALERRYPTKPAMPGIPARREYEYIRHGTLCLTANFEIATGKIVMPTIGTNRTEQDYMIHIAQTINSDSTGEWIFIVDNLNTHISESLVRLVAKLCNITDDLGEKGKTGILKNKASRKAFLSNPLHRIRFAYTPKHASWLNQIEIWFSTLSKRLLRGGSFTSLDHLNQRVLKFIDFYNATMAKAYKWTYTGRPLTT